MKISIDIRVDYDDYQAKFMRDEDTNIERVVTNAMTFIRDSTGYAELFDVRCAVLNEWANTMKAEGLDFRQQWQHFPSAQDSSHFGKLRRKSLETGGGVIIDSNYNVYHRSDTIGRTRDKCVPLKRNT